jgi:hypothetical protein
MNAAVVWLFGLIVSDAPLQPPIREPRYSKQPEYLLLHFGMNAETKVWLVLDGERLYVDRNGNGHLTEPGEMVQGTLKDGRLSFPVGEIREGKRVHRDVKVDLFAPHEDSGLGRFPHWLALKAKKSNARMVKVVAEIDRSGLPGFSEPTHPKEKRTWTQDALTDYFGCLQFASSPRDASVVHFNGPLTMGLQMPYLDDGMFLAGALSELEAGVGSRGRGPGSFACIYYSPVPRSAHPIAEIKWPGGSPLETITLGERC